MRVPVRQVERCGVFFLLACPLTSLWAVLHGGDAYRDNRFERDARDAAEPRSRSAVAVAS